MRKEFTGDLRFLEELSSDELVRVYEENKEIQRKAIQENVAAAKENFLIDLSRFENTVSYNLDQEQAVIRFIGGVEGVQKFTEAIKQAYYLDTQAVEELEEKKDVETAKKIASKLAEFIGQELKKESTKENGCTFFHDFYWEELEESCYIEDGNGYKLYQGFGNERQSFN